MAEANQTEFVDFDAGSEFGNPEDMLKEALQGDQAQFDGDAEPQSGEAEDPEAQAQTEATDAEESTETDTDETDETAEAPRIEVKGGGETKEFNLDPEDPELQQTLKFGLAAKKWQSQKDRAQREVENLKSQYADYDEVKERAKVWDELEELTRLGHYDQVVKAVLGDAYDEFRKSEVAYELADESERAEMDRDRASRERELERTRYERKLKEMEEKFDAREDSVETARLRTMGTKALQRHDFTDTVDDTDLAEALNQELWQSSWNTLEQYAEDDHEITPALVAKVFSRKAKLLGAGQKRAAAKEVAKQTKAKRAKAKQQVQAKATERYPIAESKPDISGWDGRKSKDLLKMLVGRR